jgi:hypothetical protein
LEQSLNVLAPYGILSQHEMTTVYGQLQKLEPTQEQLYNDGLQLILAMMRIQRLDIKGEPSAQNNLDPTVQSNNFRLKEVLDSLRAVFNNELSPGDPPEAYLDLARAHGEEFRQLVDLARRCCAAQQTALLNKLSRAYQKPDFCIRRDALGSYRDQLLPLTFSWDENWYYGYKINLWGDPSQEAAAAPVESDSVAQSDL